MMLILGGCSSMAISPPQVGQAIGAVAGSAIAPGIGTQLGSLAGILAGMVAQGQIDKANEKHERRTLGEQMAREPQAASGAADAAAGLLARVWADETVLDGRVIAGHFESRHLQ